MANTSTSVQAIDRACLVLETIAQKGTISLNELHEIVGINKPSLSRITASLCQNGFLKRNEKSGDYSLSLKLFELGVKATQGINYLNLIRSELEALSSELGVIAQFSVEDNNELLCLESIDPNNSNFSIYTRIGGRSPLYSTSAGKAILSTYSNDEILKKWDTMHVVALTPNTIKTSDDLLKDITLIRQRNYALDIEENEPGLFCVGTVLLNYTNKPIGAISLSSKTMSDEDQQRYANTLLSHTQRLSAIFGYIQR